MNGVARRLLMGPHARARCAYGVGDFMDFAALALVDAAAPNAARPPAHVSADENDGPSFEEHLAQTDAAPAAHAPNNKEGAAEPAVTEPETPDPIAAALAGAPQPPAPPPQPGAPVLLQVIASAPETPQQPATPQAPPTPIAPAAANTPPPTNAMPKTSAPAQTPRAPTTEAPAAAEADASQDAAAQPAASDTAKPTHVAPMPAAPTQAQTAAPTQVVAPTVAAAPIVGPGAVAPVAPPPTTNTPVVVAAPVAPAAPAPRAAPVVDAKPAAENGKAASPNATAANGKSTQGKATQGQAAPTSQALDFSAFALTDAPDAPQQQAQSLSPAGLTTQNATHAQQASAAELSTARAAPAAAQVSREIIRRFDGGNTRFELRLDPPELGRVEVRLEVTRDHRVTAVISADNPQALTDLARHARELEQSLQSAGLNLSENGLSFDLRQGGEGARETERDSASARGGANAGEDETASANAPPQTARLERWRGMRIDVMA